MSNLQKSPSVADAVSGADAPAPSSPSTKKKSAQSPAQPPAQSPARASATDAVAQVRDAAVNQARRDAERVLAYGREVYAAEFSAQLTRLAGGSDMANYFRLDSSDWTLPDSPLTRNLPAVEVSAILGGA